jgi:hypothetical protein
MIRSEALIGTPAISAAVVALAPRLALAIPACADVVDPTTRPVTAAPIKSAPMVDALVDLEDMHILLAGTRRMIALVVGNLSMQPAQQCAFHHKEYETRR